MKAPAATSAAAYRTARIGRRPSSNGTRTATRIGAQPTSASATAGSADRSAPSTARPKPTDGCQRFYRERRDTLTATLAEHFPGTEVSGIAAGLHIIAHLPERYGPEPVFMARATGAGVALRPLGDFGTVSSTDRTVSLVLGYAHLAPQDIAQSVRLLAAGRETGHR